MYVLPFGKEVLLPEVTIIYANDFVSTPNSTRLIFVLFYAEAELRIFAKNP